MLSRYTFFARQILTVLLLSVLRVTAAIATDCPSAVTVISSASISASDKGLLTDKLTAVPSSDVVAARALKATLLADTGEANIYEARLTLPNTIVAFNTWVPSSRTTPVTLCDFHVLHPPVDFIATSAVTGTPSTSNLIEFFALSEAYLTVKV